MKDYNPNEKNYIEKPNPIMETARKSLNEGALAVGDQGKRITNNYKKA